MKIFLVGAVFLFSFSASAAAPAVSTAPAKGAAPAPPTAAAKAPSGADEFVKKIRAAFDRKDGAALAALFYPEGMTPKMQADHLEALKKLANNPVSRIELNPAQRDEMNEDFALKGVGTFRYILDPVNQIRIVYAGGDLKVTLFYLGVKGGAYYILPAVPVAGSSAASPANASGSILWDARVIEVSPQGSSPAKAAASATKAASRPVSIREKEIPDERLEAACGNEIGLFCEAVRKKPKALLACLEEYRDNLLPLCRTVISLRD